MNDLAHLRTAGGHGRPYLLVYNEATREEAARGHLEKLASDVGHPPLARYLAQALERRFFAGLLGHLDTQVLDWAHTASLLSETTWWISS